MTLKFVCEKDVLAAAFATASRASKAKYGIRITVTDGTLVLTGTDLDLTVEVDLSVGQSNDGAAHVPARLAADITKSLPAGAVTVTESDDSTTLTLAAGKATFDLRTLPIDDFPCFSPVDGPELTFTPELLGTAIRRVLPAASSDDNRPILTAVSLSSSPDGGLRLVATDSYRLAYTIVPGAQAPEAECLVPAGLLAEASRHFDDTAGITLRLGEREVEFDLGHVRVRGRLIEGDYPNWEPLIRPAVAGVNIDRNEALDALKRLAVVANQGQSVPIRFEPAEDEVTLTVGVQDIGNAVESIKGVDADGELPAAGFNGTYMAQGIDACPTDIIRLSYTGDALKPVLLGSPEDDSFVYLLMPVRTQ